MYFNERPYNASSGCLLKHDNGLHNDFYYVVD